MYTTLRWTTTKLRDQKKFQADGSMDARYDGATWGGCASFTKRFLGTSSWSHCEIAVNCKVKSK